MQPLDKTEGAVRIALCSAMKPIMQHKRFGDDPEMFATYLTLAQEACKVVKGHKDCLVDQIAAMIEDGVKQGVFDVADPRIAARTIFDATSRFHNPAHADEWNDPDSQVRIDALLTLLLRGLEAPKPR